MFVSRIRSDFFFISLFRFANDIRSRCIEKYRAMRYPSKSDFLARWQGVTSSCCFREIVKRESVVVVPIHGRSSAIFVAERKLQRTARNPLPSPVPSDAIMRPRGGRKAKLRHTRMHVRVMCTRFPTIVRVRIVSKVYQLICRRRKRNYSVEPFACRKSVDGILRADTVLSTNVYFSLSFAAESNKRNISRWLFSLFLSLLFAQLLLDIRIRLRILEFCYEN